ncbi:sterol carrier protein domain-containing protein [Nocardiopsis composta]
MGRPGGPGAGGARRAPPGQRGAAPAHRLPEGCSYRPDGAAADLALDVRDLASCYLGGTRVADLVRAGLVDERTPAAAAALDAALRTELLPHTSDEF